MATDLRSDAPDVQSQQTRHAPVTGPDPLSGISDIIDQGAGMYADHVKAKKEAESNANASDFQVALIDETLKDSPHLKSAEEAGAKLDDAEAQGANANVIRNRRLVELRNRLIDSPQDQKRLTEIFKNTVGDLGEELQEEEDANIDREIEAEAKAYEKYQSSMLDNTAFSTQPPEVQDARMEQVTLDISKLNLVKNRVATAKRLGKPLTKEQLETAYRSTVPGAYHLMGASLRENLSTIPDINTPQGRIQAQNMIVRLKAEALVQLSEDTEQALSTKELEEMYFAPLSQYDAALTDLSREGTSILDIMKNKNVLSEQVALAIQYPDNNAWVIKGKIDVFNSITNEAVIGRLLAKGQLDDMITMFAETLEKVSPSATPTSQRTPSLRVVGLAPEDSKGVIDVISTFVENGAKHIANPPKPDSTKEIPPEQAEADVEESKSLVTTVLDALMSPFNDDAEKATGENLQQIAKILGNEDLLELTPKHTKEAAERVTTMTSIALAQDLSSKVAAGRVGGVQGITKESIEQHVALQTDPKTGKTYFVNVGEGLPIVNKHDGWAKPLTMVKADLATALNLHYGESLTDMVKAVAVSGQGDGDYTRALSETQKILLASGSPNFLLKDEFDKEKTNKVSGVGPFDSKDFEGRTTNYMDVFDMIGDGRKLFSEMITDPNVSSENLMSMMTKEIPIEEGLTALLESGTKEADVHLKYLEEKMVETFGWGKKKPKEGVKESNSGKVKRVPTESSAKVSKLVESAEESVKKGLGKIEPLTIETKRELQDLINAGAIQYESLSTPLKKQVNKRKDRAPSNPDDHGPVGIGFNEGEVDLEYEKAKRTIKTLLKYNIITEDDIPRTLRGSN